MEAWMALLSIVAIVAVVLVAGGLIAFIVHLIVGALDKTDKSIKYENNTTMVKNTELLDYATFKQNEEGDGTNKEYNFDEINKAKAKEEKALLEQEDVNFDIVDDLPTEDDLTIAEDNNAVVAETKQEEAQVKEEDEEDIDFDAMLEEISNDVIEEEKERTQEENAPKMSEELKAYNIEDYLNETNEESSDSENEEQETVVAEEIVETEAYPEADKVEETPAEETQVEETEQVVAEADDSKQVIEDLKAQLADLNRQLEEARSSKTEIVTINMTEEECVARLETLKNRLKEVKKEYKTNLKEYKPLKKVMNDLEKYQTKLRRKDTIVAKKKVALYGVNNYVDIDKEKAEKVANDLELLEGLRLSVSHCEEVINANKDRYPILERTNQILEDQIANIEQDIASTQATLNKIREQNGEGENK